MSERNIFSTGSRDQLMSEEAREFIWRKPGRVILIANIVFLLNVLIVLIFLWFIDYPDIVKAPVIFTTNPVSASRQPGVMFNKAEMRVFQKDLKKIRLGQKVLISVDSSPGSGSRHLEGIVSEISATRSGDDSYLIKVELAEGSHTGDGSRIHIYEGLFGQGEIITGNRRLFDRMLGRSPLQTAIGR